MSVLFAGGELDDFIQAITSGSVSTATHNTNTSTYRSAYARCSMAVTGQGGNDTTVLRGAFSDPQSQFAVTFRLYYGSNWSATTGHFFRLLDGTGTNGTRLRLTGTSGSSSSVLTLAKVDASGTATTLATSATNVLGITLQRFDVVVDYQAAGSVKVYVDGTLAINYSGDPTASGSTTLSHLQLSTPNGFGGVGHYSEVIVATQDTRSLSLKTLVPDGAGDTTGWTTGAYTDVDEVTASESDVATSGTALQVLTMNCTGMPGGVGTVSVVGVKVAASALRGAAGPSKLALGVRSGGSNSFASAVTLDYWYPVGTPWASQIFEVNPVTGVAFTTSEIDALQLAFRSET